MLGKFTLRWGFYRVTAWLYSKADWRSVREVVNPAKEYKLEQIAARHEIDPMQFKRVGDKLLKVWPLLP